MDFMLKPHGYCLVENNFIIKPKRSLASPIAEKNGGINLNDKDIYGGSAEGYTAGVNFYADKNVRFQLNYSYVNHDRYANGKNKLFVGYDLTGALTKDPTQVADSKGKAGDDYGMLGFRFEINF